MTLDDLTAKLKAKFQYAKFNHTVLFDCGDDGTLFADGTKDPMEFIRGGTNDPEVTLAASLDTFDQILEGAKDPNMAFMMGKLKVRGSMGLALKLNGILEG